MPVLLNVRLIPRARQNKVDCWLDDHTVKIRLTAPPVDNKANSALVEFLSDAIHSPKSAIAIKHGLTSRNKAVEIEGKSLEEIKNRL